MPAPTIAALYKAQWEIELFFKWIKQNLRVKTFYGTSPNAVKTPIWIAMMVYLVLAILKERYRLEPSLSKLYFLEVNLFEPRLQISIFQIDPRASRPQRDKQLTLFLTYELNHGVANRMTVSKKGSLFLAKIALRSPLYFLPY